MDCNIEKLRNGILNTENIIGSYPLPTWDSLPQFDLYMDQVIILLGKYLGIFTDGGNDEKFITASMINNYVKLKIMPAPVRKKYSRLHLAYLIMICSLKQTLSMATIQKILPCDMTEERIKEVYGGFTINYNSAIEHIKKQIREFTSPVMEHDNHPDIGDLVMQVAIFSSMTKLLTEKLCDAATASESNTQPN